MFLLCFFLQAEICISTVFRSATEAASRVEEISLVERLRGLWDSFKCQGRALVVKLLAIHDPRTQ